MIISKRLFGVVIASLVIMGSQSPAGQPLGTAFTFQGQLKDGGVPADGPHNFVFRLFDDSGIQVGGNIVVNGHPVSNGLFSVDLDFGPGVFTGDKRKLEVQVNGVVLTPRQPLSATPYALYALHGPGASEAWAANGAHIHKTNAGNVGIGTTGPLDELHVRGDNATLRLEDNDTPNSFTLFEDAQPTQLRISKRNSNGLVLLDLNPKPADGSGADVRFFRETATTGLKTVRFLRGNNTTAASAVIGVDGADSFLQLHGGNVGMGTAEPTAKLEVVGDPGTEPAVEAVGYWGIYGQANSVSGYGGVFACSDGIDGAGRALLVGGASELNGSLLVGNALGPPAVAKLQVVNGTDSEPSGGGHVVIGGVAGTNISIDNNEIMARDNGAPSSLFINNDGGDVVFGGPINIGYQIVTHIRTTTGDAAWNVDVSCPAGKRVIGGGCSGDAERDVSDSRPEGTTGWHCLFSPGDAGEVIKAYAICANVK